MSNVALWKDILCQPSRKAHIVQFYQEDDFLARGVSCYLSEGFQKGAAAVVIMTPPHWTRVREKLMNLGVPVGDLELQGRILVLDAQDTLASVLKDGAPDRGLFQTQVAERIRQSKLLTGDAEVRAYGEMVDLLWQEGRLEAAIELERLWNELIRDKRFSLLCAYKVDLWDSRLSERESRGIFHEHSHLIPGEDYERLNNSFDRAMEVVIGKARMNSLRPLIAANKNRLPVMPGAQAAILWIRDNLPEALAAVLHHAQRHYKEHEELSPAG